MSSSPLEELFDIHVDTQFANLNCQPDEYATEPWKHYRDGPNAYLSIRYQKRKDFLQKLSLPMKTRVEHELERIDRTRKNFSSYPNKKALMQELIDSRKAWHTSVVENLNNFQAAVEKDHQADPENPRHRRDRELLMRFESWRSRHSVQLSPTKGRASLINKVLREGTFARRPSQAQPQVIVEEFSDVAPISSPSTTKDEQIQQEPMYGFKASAIYFKKKGDEWAGYTHPDGKLIGKDKFPNQKIAVHDLLEGHGSNSPLHEHCPPDMIRYFHFPTNNMAWIEKAIARYYREDFHVPIDEHITFNKTTRKTEKLLAREYWRGQMHGTSGLDRATFVHQDQVHSRTGRKEIPSREPTTRGAPVHARHMRSRCFFIPRATTETSESNRFGTEKNVALFMPYLHWETSSRRAKMVQVVNEAITSPEGSTSNPNSQKQKETFPSAVAQLDGTGSPKFVPTYKHHLGKYLMTVARVADEMDFEADERLLRENVNRNPPLHIRRTIDQYYFPTLEDTSVRDKDQVVYRGTRAGRSFHTKNTRVVMVDQLWLWILDDHTIITSFPRRWGRNKPDPSGVHKSLRERLEAMSGGIKSIHHLALMIIDQCSGVFFDRTKPLDQRPEVMDLFSSAIGHVTELTAVAFEGFWRNTALQARNFLSGSKYLEINPEGKLLQEVQDIAEELQIMKRIYNEQLQVVKDFKRHLDHQPEAGRRKDESKDMAALLSKILETMLQERHNQSGDVTGETGREPGSSTENIMPPVDQSSLEETIHEACVLLELIESRKAEIQDKEESALHTCQHIEGLLSLKQQQASIVEAKAAIRRADETIRQGRSIMAFTVVTIFFLPLGFFATFFGMNNLEINGATWMTLNEQIRYMFGLSTIVIVLSVSLAFSAWSRAVLSFVFWVPLAMLAESTGFLDWWRQSPAYHVNLERQAIKIVGNASKERRKRRIVKNASKELEKRREREKDEETERLARLGEEPKSDGSLIVRVLGGGRESTRANVAFRVDGSDNVV